MRCQGTAAAVDANLGERRVAANRNIFLNLIHEGLVFLGAVQKGKVVVNEPGSAVMDTGGSSKAVATMLYANDVLVFFMRFYLLYYAHPRSWTRTI